MAHFANVNAASIIKVVNSCSGGISSVRANSLLADGKSLVWDGSGAKDNMVSSLESIKSQTKALTAALQKILGIANTIQDYKTAYSGYKTLKSQCAAAKSRYKNADPTKPSYGYLQNNYYQKKNAKERVKQKVDRLEKKLTGMGYPPSSY